MEIVEIVNLSSEELVSIEGGFLPLIIIGAAALLLVSCDDKSKKGYEVSVDCNSCDVEVKGDTVIVKPKK